MTEASATPDSNASAAIALAGIAGALGVGIGAFGGHGLDAYLESTGWEPEVIARRAEQFEIGVRYHLIHAVALLALAAFERSVGRHGRGVLAASVALMVAGIVLFSGSLYLLVLTGKSWLGMITPCGGLSWIVAWSLLVVAGWQQQRAPLRA